MVAPTNRECENCDQPATSFVVVTDTDDNTWWGRYVVGEWLPVCAFHEKHLLEDFPVRELTDDERRD